MGRSDELYISMKIQKMCQRLDSDDVGERFEARRFIRNKLPIILGGADGARIDGGPGSGNWGHGGRKGKVGGSSSGGGAQNRLSTPSGGFTSRSQAEKENRKRDMERKAKAGGAVGSSGKQAGSKKEPTLKVVKHPKIKDKNTDFLMNMSDEDKKEILFDCSTHWRREPYLEQKAAEALKTGDFSKLSDSEARELNGAAQRRRELKAYRERNAKVNANKDRLDKLLDERRKINKEIDAMPAKKAKEHMEEFRKRFGEIEAEEKRLGEENSRLSALKFNGEKDIENWEKIKNG